MRRHGGRDHSRLLPTSLAEAGHGRATCSWRAGALCLVLPALLLSAHLYSGGGLPGLFSSASNSGGRQLGDSSLAEVEPTTANNLATVPGPDRQAKAAAADRNDTGNASAAPDADSQQQLAVDGPLAEAEAEKAPEQQTDGKQPDGPDAEAESETPPPETASKAAKPASAAATRLPSYPAAPTTGERWWLDLTAELTPTSYNGKFSKKITSQFGQDGILAYIFDHIGTTNKYYVEFGFDAGSWELSVQGGSGPNTANLYNNGWSGLLMDGGHDNQTMNLQQEMIFEHNIVSLFDKYGVPAEPDYVSVDIDSYDLWVFKAILTSGKYRPRVLTAEYNCNCPLGATFSFPNDPLERWDAWREGFDTAGRFMGACLGAFRMVAQEAGYSLVYVEKPVDAFFVRNDLLRGPVPAYATFEYAVNPHCQLHHPSSHEFIGRWVDYKTMSETGDLQAAKDAALQQMRVLHVFADFFVNVTED